MTEIEGKCLYEDKKELEKRNLEISRYARKLESEIEELKKKLEQAKKVKVVEHFEAYGQCRDSRRIANLEAQIEKMKDCSNCKYLYIQDNADLEGTRTDPCLSCRSHNMWNLNFKGVSMTEELSTGLRKLEIERTLKKAGWTVHEDDYYKQKKKEELIETIRMLENNWSNAIERHENTISYHNQTIAELDKMFQKLKGGK